MTISLTVDIGVQGKDNTQATFNAVEKNLSTVAEKITAFSTAWQAFGEKLFRAFEDPIKNAEKAETATVRLATSLQIAGKYSAETMTDISDFSETMKKLGGVNEDVVKSIVATNVAIGETVPQAEEAARAAVALAKFQGVDLVSANEELIGSLNGMDRALRKVAPGIQGLTMDQKRHGESIKLVGDALKSFVEADAKTTAGAIERLAIGWEDLGKKVGGYVLEGVGLGGHFSTLNSALTDLETLVVDNKDVIVTFANNLTTKAIEAIKGFSESMAEAGPILGGFLGGISDLSKHLIPFATLLLNVGSAYSALAGDEKTEKALDKLREKLLGIHEAFLEGTDTPAIDWDAKLNTAGLDRAATHFDKLKKPAENAGGFSDSDIFRKLYPSTAQDTVRPGASVGELRSSGAENQITGNTGRINLPMTDAQKQQQLHMQRTLNDERLALELSYGNDLVAQHALALRKIVQLQEDAKRDGVNITKEANALKAALDAKLVEDQRKAFVADRLAAATAANDQLAIANATYMADIRAAAEAFKKKKSTLEEYTAAVREAGAKHEAFALGNQLNIAQLTGNTTLAAKLELDKQLIDLKKMYDDGLILDQQYIDAKTEIERKAREKDRAQGSTGSDSKDDSLKKATAVVGSLQGGISSVISAIGSMYGIIGQFIAGIINFLNQPPKQFQNMLQQLNTAIPEIFKNVFQHSIPYILESFPSALAEVLRTVLSVPFWGSVIKGLWDALMNMFKNFWVVLFGGQQMNQFKEAASGPQKQQVQFGNDQAGAGNEDFKIKDADLRNARKANTFEDTFTAAVDKGGESLSNVLGEAFSNIEKWFESLPEKLWASLEKLANGIWKWGDAIWKAFADPGTKWDPLGQAIFHGLSVAATTLGDWGTKIWNGFVTAMNNGASSLSDMFGKAGGWISTALGKGIDGLQDKFHDLGIKISDAFKGALTTMGATFSGYGSKIWDGLKASLDNAVLSIKYFEYLGTNIWNGLKNSLDKVGDIFKGLGDTIWQGLKAGLGSVSGGSGGGSLLSKATGGVLNAGGYVTRDMASPHLAALFGAAGALRLAGGGDVPGVGFTDTIPILGTPGERMLNRQEAADYRQGKGGEQQINFTFNVSAGAVFDRAAVQQAMPLMIKELRSRSRAGENVVHPNGVY